MTFVARFTVDSADPKELDGLDVPWLGILVFSKTFHVGIIGTATTVFLSAGITEGSRSYVATEQIRGHTDDGEFGAVVVQHGGLEADPSTWFGYVVPGTGTGSFAEWAGSARIRHDDTGPYFEFDLA